MTLKELKEITKKFVEDGIADDGLVVYNFSFEVPKVLEELFERASYSISFNLNLPLDSKSKLAFFSVYYNKDSKYLSKKSEVIDTKTNADYNYINKRVLKISLSFQRINNFLTLLEPLEKYHYQGFFDLFYYTPLKGGTFSVHVGDFLIDFSYYGKIL